MATAYPDSPYGISILLDFFSGPPQYEVPMSVVNQAKALPVAWVRLIFSWSRVETGSPGNYVWPAGLDVTIQRFNSVGINVAYAITNPPSFRRGQSWGGGFHYAMASEMLTFVQQVATRYQRGSVNGTISAVEVGNEDYCVQNDIYHNGGWQAEALNACYPAVKAIDPQMLVICGGQLQTSTTFVPRYQAQLYTGGGVSSSGGMGANCDATNSHYYRGNLKDPDNNTYPHTYTIANKLIAMHQADITGDGHTGYPNRDFWVTEFGWEATQTGSSKYITWAQQSQYLMEVVDAARMSGFCSHAFIYTMDYADTNTIVASSSKVLPAYTAYQAYIAKYPTWGGSGPPLSQYESTVLADNPQAYYRLDEQVGLSCKDVSPHSLTGTYSTTGVTYAESGLISGDSDTAVLFDGQNGQMTCPGGINMTGWTAVTLEAWVELPSLSFVTPAPIWANDQPGISNNGVSLFIGAGGTNITFALGNGTTALSLVGTYTFLANTRYYVAATYNGSVAAIYVNALTSTPLATGAFSGTIGMPAGPLTLGGNPVSGNNFPGEMDEATVYKNTSLSVTRILYHYTQGTGGIAPPPTFTLTPTALSPTAPGVTKTGNTYRATVSLGETSGSIGTATWTAASSLSGVTFTPSSGSLSPGGTPTLITIANIPSLNGTFTFSGGEGETAVVTTWTVVQTSPAGGYALFANGAGVASFDHYRVTGYPDPALSLLACGRLGASVANYNVNIPDVQTGLAMATSLDGVNWTPLANAGDPIAGLTTMPAVFSDTFFTDSSANYTSTHETGGANSTWTWDTAHVRLVAAGGTNGFLISSLLSGITDMSLFVDMDYADAGGVVFHYIDSGDCYVLFIRDSGNLGGNPNTITLQKVVGGTSTTIIPNTAIAFNRNTYHRIRVDMLGQVITVYFDGVQIATYTDTSPLAAGAVGLRNSTSGGASTARFYQLYCQPQGQLVSSMDSYAYAQLTLTSTDPLNSPQVLDCATLVTGPTIGLGALIPGVTYQRTFCSANFDDLKKQSDYFWFIDATKKLSFVPRTSLPAPWIVQASDQANSNIQVAGVSVEYSGDLYRNREILQNVQAQQSFIQYFVGDGKSTSWTLNYPVATGTVPTLLLNGTTPLSVGIQGQTTGMQYYYTPGNTGIAQDQSQGVLNVLQTLVVEYTGTFVTDVVIDNLDADDFPGTVCQTAYAAIDGSSGVVEDVLDVSQVDITKNMNLPAAQQYGGQLLQEYGVIGRTITLTTTKSGLQPGQSVAVFLPQYGINNMQALVTQVDIDVKQVGDGSLLYLFTVTASEGPVLSNWVKVFGSLF